MIRAACLLLVVIVLLATVAGAEHEVYYRYVVLGFAKDARGKPATGKAVEVIRDKTGFSYLGETDAQGFFVLLVRLGDESVGESLTLKVGTGQTRLVARFDPANHADARGTRVDLEGARFVERSAWFPSTLARYLETPAR